MRLRGAVARREVCGKRRTLQSGHGTPLENPISKPSRAFPTRTYRVTRGVTGCLPRSPSCTTVAGRRIHIGKMQVDESNAVSRCTVGHHARSSPLKHGEPANQEARRVQLLRGRNNDSNNCNKYIRQIQYKHYMTNNKPIL